MPSAKAFPLPKLMEAVQQYQEQSRQRVFVEYVVLAGVNDSIELAHELGTLLQGRNMVLNLIPWNPVYSPDGPAFEAPPLGRVQVSRGANIRSSQMQRRRDFRYWPK